MLTASITIFALLILIQLSCTRGFVRWCVFHLFQVHLDYEGPGMILGLWFQARNLRAIFAPDGGMDRFYFEAGKIHFAVSPLHLLFGRILLLKPYLAHAYLEYINRIDSHKKNRFLPGRHRIEFKDLDVVDGSVTVVDETIPGPYRLNISQIQLESADMDLSTPVDLFFRMDHGHALIGSGKIEAGRSRETGFIKIRGITWGEITSLERLPLMGYGFSLSAYHRGGSNTREVEGHLRILDGSGAGSDKGIPYSFRIRWSDYNLTMDLGIQKLIENILNSARPGLMERGLVLGSKSVFDLVKKPQFDTESDKPPL
ncbi:MAG: hypothetical protein KDK33_16780 [Leptospiraceae bacterium]|nr:hypothetical protein [Leptospiraceae bacterium]